GHVVTTVPGAPIPIAGTEIGLDEFDQLNTANLAFAAAIVAAGKATPPDLNGAFFVPNSGSPDFDPSITSFLCTDAAHAIFAGAAAKLDAMTLDHPEWKFNKPDNQGMLTNAQCWTHARDFYKYADIEGYRGTPHKL